jgi:hypothetical protein
VRAHAWVRVRAACVLVSTGRAADEKFLATDRAPPHSMWSPRPFAPDAQLHCGAGRTETRDRARSGRIPGPAGLVSGIVRVLGLRHVTAVGSQPELQSDDEQVCRCGGEPDEQPGGMPVRNLGHDPYQQDARPDRR